MDDDKAKKSDTESASEKPDEPTKVTEDSSATESLDEATAMTPDSSAAEKPVAVTPATPDSSAAEKPVGETPVTPDPLAAKSVVTDRPTVRPASREQHSPKPTDTKGQNSGKASSGTPSLEQMNEIILKKSRSVGMIMKWSLSTYFKFNPTYFLQLRGIMNIFHLIFSLVILIMLSQSCHLYGHDMKISDGFYCRSSETFLFVIAISSFLMSVLYFFCCLLSKKTEALLYHTTLEVSYFIMYAILNIIAAIAVMLTEDRTTFEEDVKTSYNYNLSYASGVLALINGLFYATSAIAFFLTHRFHDSEESENGEERI